MSHSPDPRCYASVGVGWDERLYPACSACGWVGNSFEKHQYDDARLEAERHSDPEVLKELADWVALNSVPDSPFPYPDPDYLIEAMNS